MQMSGRQVGDKVQLGGSTNYIGSAAYARGQDRSHRMDVCKSSKEDEGRRRASLMSLRDKILSGGGKYTVMTNVAVELELEYQADSVAGKFHLRPPTAAACAVMRTHRFLISALPTARCVAVAELADDFRSALNSGQSVVECSLPNPARALLELDVSPSERHDVALLLVGALASPAKVKTFIFSEPDRSLHELDDFGEFKVPENLAAAGCKNQLLACLTRPSLAVCFWCRAGAATHRLSGCSKCMAVSYCSRKCQLADWTAFHKQECKQLKAGTATKASLDLHLVARDDYLTADGRERHKFPFSLGAEATLGKGKGGVFEGDVIFSYPCNHKDGCITADTTLHPTAWLLGKL